MVLLFGGNEGQIRQSKSKRMLVGGSLLFLGFLFYSALPGSVVSGTENEIDQDSLMIQSRFRKSNKSNSVVEMYDVQVENLSLGKNSLKEEHVDLEGWSNEDLNLERKSLELEVTLPEVSQQSTEDHVPDVVDDQSCSLISQIGCNSELGKEVVGDDNDTIIISIQEEQDSEEQISLQEQDDEQGDEKEEGDDVNEIPEQDKAVDEMEELEEFQSEQRIEEEDGSEEEEEEEVAVDGDLGSVDDKLVLNGGKVEMVGLSK